MKYLFQRRLTPGLWKLLWMITAVLYKWGK
jgi:hypothetical protein